MELVLIFSFSTELVLLVFRLVLRRREWDGVVHGTVMLFYPPLNSTSLPCSEPANVGWVIFFIHLQYIHTHHIKVFLEQKWDNFSHGYALKGTKNIVV